MARIQKFGFRGMDKVRKNLEALGEAVDKDEIYRIVGEAAKIGKHEVAKEARVISGEVAESAFSFSKPRGMTVLGFSSFAGKQKTALFGINKEKTMREWIAAAGNKSPRAKVAPGGKVAMSLAAMLEIGTSRMPARPFFRPAMQAARPEMARVLFTGFKKLIADTIAKQKTS